jgi:drug/metabolite transporter (DMT)-like permease
MSALAGAASGAFSALISRRYLLGLPPLVLATGSQIGATLVLAVPALLLWPEAIPGASAWLGAAGSGVVCTGISYLLFFRLEEKAGPSRALTVTFLMPQFAMFYGFVLLGESITAGMLGCAALIIGGTALSTGMFSRKKI